ncbi:GNAT family N-acetyltransferase [Mesorhizobium sangaii]|uniref:RimJ/RimL family protein N-acetyltransferase n=1 Tax=Mesorhizobium sangaii TaxID=505389 RepID=A0A841PIG2_9HYPH|nr:GNAT family N-acetyltransferase [Mesorhizobium sangaii]MBB6413761.1 RimJ/RimL family protein N-acetyltransferase [Mesorhizobium sangaii]
MELQTERLLLRKWRDEDVELIVRLVEEPNAGKYLTEFSNREKIYEWIKAERDGFERHGYGLFAIERLESAGFIGFCGLVNVGYQAHFTPAVEMYWRIHPDYWGHGYATEAAAALAAYGFEKLKLNQIVAIAAVENVASRRVMERMGMSHDPGDDFDHPLKAVGDPLRRQVLYRINPREWHRRRKL